ncbi:MAG: hypothetical protein HYX20_03840 [Candidatus Yanofskybacteria bacterium]|nr:hypothetical protein [Candidatus Yanofskybacteria bacterium]
MEQKTIPEPKEPTREDLEELEKLGKVDDPFFQRLEDQMKSPEGLEGIKIQGEADKKELDTEVEKWQAFLKEFWKWEKYYSMGTMGIIGDQPLHIDPDVKFENQNKFEIPLKFPDYLVSKALEEADSEILEKLKNALKNLNEIVFSDITKSRNLLLLTLKSKNKKMALLFEKFYPFNFQKGKEFLR